MPASAGIIPRAMRRIKIGVLGSGKGSNFRSILSEIQAGRLSAEPVLVASDVAGAGILAIAREAGVPTYEIQEPQFRTKLTPDVEQALVEALLQAGTELVVLAGYMRVVKAPLLEAFPRRIINIHPSLLPAFPGISAWKQAVEACVSESGCTVHFVDAGIDTGKIIAQTHISVLPSDSPESLHERIQEAEHILYPAVVKRFADGELP